MHQYSKRIVFFGENSCYRVADCLYNHFLSSKLFILYLSYFFNIVIDAAFERTFMKLLRLLPLAFVGMMVMPQANALDIKQDNINNCVSGAVKYKVADKSTATKLCNCTIGVRSKMTIGQMWEIESYAQSKKDPSSLSYVKKMQKDLQQCTVGLNLKQPQKPA